MLVTYVSHKTQVGWGDYELDELDAVRIEVANQGDPLLGAVLLLDKAEAIQLLGDLVVTLLRDEAGTLPPAQNLRELAHHSQLFRDLLAMLRGHR